MRRLLPANLPRDEALMVIGKFRALDVDRSGTLTLDELVRLLTEVRALSCVFIWPPVLYLPHLCEAPVHITDGRVRRTDHG